MHSSSEIDRFILRLRRRVRRAESAALLALFAGAAALTALALLALTPAAESARGPQLAALLAAASWLLSLAWSWWRLRSRWRDPARLVARLGPQHRALRSDLLSSVQLAGAAPSTCSPTLLAALARQTSEALRQLPPAGVLTPPSWRPAALLGGSAALAWTAALAWHPGYWALAARQLVDAVRAAPQVARQPLVGAVVLEYRYPAYMGRAVVRVPDTTGDITAPPGTQVLVRATSTVPVSHADLVVSGGDGGLALRQPLGVGPHGVLSGVLTVGDAARYHFELLTGGARALRDPIERRIEIEPDLGPKVALVGPPNDTAVNARQQIELGFGAEDDWGLSQVRFVYRIDTQPPTSRTLWQHPVIGAPARYASGTHVWDLGALELAGTFTLRYWIEATDNDVIHGPTSTRSSVQRLTIVNREQQHAQTLGQQRQLLEQALTLLAEHLLLPSSRPRSLRHPPAPAPGGSRLAALLEQQTRWVAALRALNQQLRRDPLVSAVVIRSVAALVERWHALLRSAPTGTAAAPSYYRRSIVALERDTLLLADLIDEQQLQTLGVTARELQSDRARLATLIARWREAPSPALRARILREMERLGQRATQLMQATNRLHATLPDEYLNASAVEGLAVGRDLEQLRRLFHARQLGGVEALMAQLDGKLDQLQRLLDANVEQFRSARLDERERVWHAALGTLHELQRQQQQLAGATESLVRSYRQRGAQLLEDRLAGLVARQQPRAEQVQRHLRTTAPQRLASYHREEIERTLRWTGWLQERLAAHDLDQAAQLAQRLADGLEQVGADLREDTLGDDVPGWREPQDRAIAHVERALGLAQQIAEDLEQALPRPSTLLREPERRQLRELTQQQRGLAKQAAGLERTRDGDVAGDLLGERGRELLGQARRMMRDATGQLGGLEPQRAHSAQQGALQQLAELQLLLEQSRRPGPAEGAGGERERVAIPGAESFAPPPAFRRELLDAMAESAPSSYAQQVKQYYRELVR